MDYLRVIPKETKVINIKPIEKSPEDELIQILDTLIKGYSGSIITVHGAAIAMAAAQLRALLKEKQ